jgi:AbrB family looped-hinge helix DNA binding protein
MKNERLEVLTRLGPKGQVVLRKDMRAALGLEPGSMVSMKRVDSKVIVTPVKKEEIIAEVERIAKMVSKKIPKGRTSVDIIREQRD